MIVEIPDPLHRLIKTLAGSKGESIKSLVLRALENVVQKENNITVKNKSDGIYITEEQADAMLEPVILKHIDQIKKGKFEGYNKKEFFTKLKK